MITEKRYLKALAIVKEYEKQLRFVDSKNTVSKTKLVLLDDCLYDVEIDGHSHKMSNRFEFLEVVEILLTKPQYEKYIGDCTEREFDVSEDRIDKMLEHIKDNMWRR